MTIDIGGGVGAPPSITHEGHDWMKRGAQTAASWSGAALLSLTLVLAAVPAHADAATDEPSIPESSLAEPSTTGSAETTADPDDMQNQDDDSPSTGDETPTDPPEEPTEQPTDSEEPTETLEPTEPQEPTEEPAEPEEPTDEPSGTPSLEPTDPDDELSPSPSGDPEAPATGAPSQGPGQQPGQDEHYIRCGSVLVAPGQTETPRLDMSSGLTGLTTGSSLTGASIRIEGNVVYYQAPSPLPPGASQDDFSVSAVAPDGSPVSTRCYVGLQEGAGGGSSAQPPSPSPTRASQTEETPGSGSVAPTGSAAPTTSAAPTSSGTPQEFPEGTALPGIPGMPGYTLPELSSPASTDEGAPTAEPELAQTGPDAASVAASVSLAVLAIIAGAAAIALASRRARAAQ
ncbi:hypothetical protein [Nesterenkonia lutea]|uniref:Outer membrane biosynthesis protein TonB n=1 Tax=Nesterenkonia lutea TaxID=272919 RepID=A0ABR9JFR8_9MICC|nr:hypothetical protein [Nesterenkonia lutea]MBE1524774.1 outer membrane biosynthesis protein TonB [Nesterenkonia lutea]